MTHEERALRALDYYAFMENPDLKLIIMKEIKEAVEQEREACAKVCVELNETNPMFGAHLKCAEAIRARNAK